MFGVVYFTPTYFSPAHFGGVVGEGGAAYVDASLSVTASASATLAATGGAQPAAAVGGGGMPRRYATGPAYAPRPPERLPRYVDAALVVTAAASGDFAARSVSGAAFAVATGAIPAFAARLDVAAGMASVASGEAAFSVTLVARPVDLTAQRRRREAELMLLLAA